MPDADHIIVTVNLGVLILSRPDPKPFNRKLIKSRSEYAKDAVKDAKFAAESGKGRINREEDVGDTAGAARHTISGTVSDKK